MAEVIVMILTGLGSMFVLLAAIGLVRMPDLYLRISVTTKAATLGVGLILAAAAVWYEDVGVTSRVIATIFFIFLTAPVGAHLLGRASYISGVPLWKGSWLNRLQGKYNPAKETLEGVSAEELKKSTD
jgi:multicomponent Na+:H+ antiporter subunit G